MTETNFSHQRALFFGDEDPEDQPASLDFARSLAVVVGINDYRHVPRLRTAVPDAEELARLLHAEYGYEAQLLTQDVTLARFQALLAGLRDTVGADDRVVFYFAGHGIALEGDDGPAGYLVPQDGRPEDRSTFLRMDEFHDALMALPCRHMLIILDCCFAGAMRWASTRALSTLPEVIHKERYERFIRDPAWQVITSAAYDQKALDVLAGDVVGARGDAAGQHSPFALALFEALRGAGDVVPAGGGDGVITAAELYLYLRDYVEVKAAETAGHYQTPGLWPLKKHDKGEYIFLTPGHELNLPPAPELTYDNNPYRGLKAFEEKHAALFFGRTALVKTLADVVTRQPLTVVLGASGTGKSSVVKAGLLPHLGGTVKADAGTSREPNAQGWAILPPMRPTEAPLHELAYLLCHHLPDLGQASGSPATPRALANLVAYWARLHPEHKLLLVIDQFEELVTLCRTPAEREQFLTALAMILNVRPEQVRVILTLRSDFEPQVVEGPLQGRWPAARFIIPPMTQAELREAIEGPAGARVLYFEPPALVDRLIDEVIQTPGALPLLSFTLSELYIKYLERRGNDRALSQADYEALGGVVGSLRNRATEEYEHLPDAAHQATMQRVMLRMVASEGGELARRRVPRVELVYPDEAENAHVTEVIQRLDQARLVVSGKTDEGEAYVEPAHDALVRAWDKLLVWYREAETYLPLQRRLTQAAGEWADETNERTKTDLLWNEDPRLPQVEQTLAGNPEPVKRSWVAQQWLHFRDLWRSTPLPAVAGHWLNALELDFVQHSVAQRRKEGRRLVGTVAGVMVVLVALTVFALIQANLAEERARIALSRQLAAQSQEIIAAQPAYLPRAILLATESLGRTYTYEGLQSLGDGLKLLPRRIAHVNHDGYINAVAYSSDGRWIATASEDGTARVWDAANGCELIRMIHNGAVYTVIFSPDGQRLATRSRNAASVWDISAAHDFELAQVTVATSPIVRMIYDDRAHTNIRGSVIDFSSDGQWVISAGCDEYDESNESWCIRGKAHMWEAEHGYELISMIHDDWVKAVAFSPDDQQIATTSGAAACVWDVSNALNVRIVNSDKATCMWHDHTVDSVSFGPKNDVRWLATISGRDVYVWDVSIDPYTHLARGTVLARLQHGNSVWSVAFNPNGQQIVTASADKTARVWEISLDTNTGTVHSRELARLPHNGFVEAAVFNPGGELVATAGWDNTSRIWEVKSELELTRMTHDSRVSAIAFSPDGQQLATASLDNTASVWNTVSSRELIRVAHESQVWAVAISPNNQWIATGSWDTTVRIWEIASGRELACLKHNGYVYNVAFSLDGQWIATASSGGDVYVWNISAVLESVQSQDVCLDATSAHGFITLIHPESVGSVAFSADGQWLATASEDNIARVWKISAQHIVAQMIHTDVVRAIAFSPNQDWVVTGGDDRTARVWDISAALKLESRDAMTEVINAREVISVTHKNEVRDVAFSLDGKWIISVDGNVARIWEAAKGHPIANFEHDSSIYAVAFSSNGQWVVTASNQDKTARVWEIRTARELARVTHNGAVHDVAFSPNGQWIATASEDWTARVWPWQTQDMLDIACANLTRNLTNEEWRIYFGDESYRKTCPDLP